LHEGPNLSGVDPQSGRTVKLFHPRRNIWSRHFEWNGAVLFGKTMIARATIEVLAINDADQLAARRALLDEGFKLG
jgi:hypothetical protein